jgi:hypothetical protein
MFRGRAKRPEHLARVRGVRDELAALDVSVLLTDQPFLRVPGTAAALAGDPLDAAALSDVLGSKRLELGPRTNLDVEEPPPPVDPGLARFLPCGCERERWRLVADSRTRRALRIFRLAAFFRLIVAIANSLCYRAPERPPRLKNWTARSCFSAAWRVVNVPRLRRLPVFGLTFIE